MYYDASDISKSKDGIIHTLLDEKKWLDEQLNDLYKENYALQEKNEKLEKTVGALKEQIKALKMEQI